MRRGVCLALVCVVSLLAAATAAQAQHFGRNKVEYVDFDFRILETEHFDVYYYSGQQDAAKLAARLAERWYARLSTLLDHRLSTRQPLILYGSQPEFAQTNVVSSFLGEGIGGVTESAKRRIVMPFAPTLAETDQILGHEIVHAFQYDITRRQRSGLSWPLWAVEGMAQYLALGAADRDAATWLRDAVHSKLLPDKRGEAERAFSPYRYGHAMWAYLAGRFGDRVARETLRANGSIEKRIETVTGVPLDTLFADWRLAAGGHYGAAPETDGRSPLVRGERRGRFHLGPALSPDGHRAVFFSEKDRLSLDLFVADTSSGAVTRKLVTTSGTARYESLQAIRSAGSWNDRGDRFVIAAVEHGQPALIVFDMTRGRQERTIKLPQLGQILTPAWSPDGSALVFAALEGGTTDLYVYDLRAASLRRLTNDVFADLQPAWSPDGSRIAFSTDRFTSDLESLTFGTPQLAFVDVRSGAIQRVIAFESSSHFNPQWSGDCDELYFVADPGGVRNVYRLDLRTRSLSQITDVAGGVVGLSPTSPVLSVARSAPALAFTQFRAGRYQVEMRRGAEVLDGRAVATPSAAIATTLPPDARADDDVAEMLADGAGAQTHEPHARAYVPNLFVEAIGQPSISSGGGPFGTFWRGGGSLLFSDVLGERKVLTYAQISNRLRETAFGVRYLNRERRWNWGGTAELQPSMRRLPRRRVGDEAGEAAVTRETVYFDRSQLRAGGFVAYPFNQGQRVELDAGIRYTRYRQHVVSTVRSLDTGRVLRRSSTEMADQNPSTIGELSAALVGDTAVFGPAGPIVGQRYRFEVASTVGEISVNRLMIDYRRYLMPVKPYTLAARVVHLGYYGRDVEDPRLLPTFLGSRQFVRGYGWSSLQCPRDVDGDCAAYEDLLGSRLVVGNLEVRFPLLGILSRDIKYGPIPAEGFFFADSGVVWSRSPIFTASSHDRQVVGSFGAGVRVSAFVPLELAIVRAISNPARGWSFDVSFRPSF
jgi:surface antigen Omp85-like protein/WD40 repeat protein